MLGNNRRRSSPSITALGMPSRPMVARLSSTHGLPASNHTRPLRTSRSASVSSSISSHSVRARHAIAVYHSLAPCPKRMSRVSPPLDCRA